jgi:hypothetical protein
LSPQRLLLHLFSASSLLQTTTSKNTSNVFTFPWLNRILSTDFAVEA